MASSGSTAPAMKDNKLAPAVWPGRHAAAMRFGMPYRHGAGLAHLITP